MSNLKIYIQINKEFEIARLITLEKLANWISDNNLYCESAGTIKRIYKNKINVKILREIIRNGECELYPYCSLNDESDSFAKEVDDLSPEDKVKKGIFRCHSDFYCVNNKLQNIKK